MVPTAEKDGKTSHQRVNGMSGRGLRLGSALWRQAPDQCGLRNSLIFGMGF
jgi:hypothetical protein